jgi:bis(5'-nucleosyl)-tetraphosphatase (symmetrical)
MATYAIGDVQGCMSALARLLDLIQFAPASDRLWLVGDLVNRGPDSLPVLRYINGLGRSAMVVLGNHDLHLLGIASGTTPVGRKDTVGQVLDAPDREDLLLWLRRRPLLYEEGEYVLVHAGLLPQWSPQAAAGLAREVETALQGEGYRDLLLFFAGGIPSGWSEDLSGMERLAMIANVLTRLRICSAGGVPDFSFTAGMDAVPSGYMPWFQVPSRRTADRTVIFGHWSALGLMLRRNVIALDSGCAWGRQLTAVRLEDRKVFQVPCDG